MSLENTENIRNKLMDILEDELSALKLDEIDNSNENDKVNLHPVNEGEENADKENFSSSDTTAELLKEVDNNQHDEKYEVDEAINLTKENDSEENYYSIKYQDQERKLAHQENAVVIKKEKSEDSLESTKFENNECMTNEEGFIPPSESLAEKIRNRVEFYFEDYNLFKNSFLLGHIRRNKKGYVNLKLVSSLRKIKSLTRDSRVVAYSLNSSKVLQLNPEGNKIRRIEPIPRPEDTNFGKTLMVFNLPPQNLSPDSLKEIFAKFGTIISADVYEIDSPESDIYHQRCLFFHRKIASKVYGIVEFENYDEVVRALKDEEGYLPKENEVKAVPLLPQIYKKEKRHLKFLKPYNANSWRRYDRYRPRNDYYSEASSSGDITRNEKMNMRGGYTYKRGYFQRSYRGRKYFMPSNSKSYEDDYVPRKWNQPFQEMPKKWGENRQLRANNSHNIDRLYPNMQRKKTVNEYINHGAYA